MTIFIVTVLLGLNLWLQSPVFGLIMAGIFLLFLNWRRYNLAETILISLAWLALAGSFFYYTYKLSNLTIYLVIISLPVLLYFLKKPKEAVAISPPNNLNWSEAGALALTMLSLWVLFSARTSEAIVSPWPEIPNTFFVLLFALLALFIIKPSKFKLGFSFTLVFSVALIVYQPGFGFDPFIHRAAEKYISLHGDITPKTFYYIGQYSIVTIISKLLALSVELVDKLLLPIGAAWLLTPWLFQLFKRYAIFFLVLPFGYFAATTPFGLALLFFLIILALDLTGTDNRLLLLAALASLTIHPIVGIPAFIFLGLKKIEKYNWFKTWWGQTALLTSASLILPFIFIKLGRLSPHWPKLELSAESFSRRFSFWLDLLRVYEWLLYPTIIIAGAWLAYKLKPNFFRLFLILGSSGLFVKYFVGFDMLPSYEQENFADRLLYLALMSLLFPILIFIERQMLRINFHSRFTKAIFWSGAIIVLIFSVYLSYPRKDNYVVAKGWSTGQADFAAVKQIEEDARGRAYIVLANQTTSAAALDTFGFRYLKSNGDDFFFYPIPTSGPLYQKYLDLVYRRNTKTTVLEAMDYAQVDLAYFAISDYWWNAKKIVEQSKTWADQWFLVDGGKVTVFKIRK